MNPSLEGLIEAHSRWFLPCRGLEPDWPRRKAAATAPLLELAPVFSTGSSCRRGVLSLDGHGANGRVRRCRMSGDTAEGPSGPEMAIRGPRQQCSGRAVSRHVEPSTSLAARRVRALELIALVLRWTASVVAAASVVWLLGDVLLLVFAATLFVLGLRGWRTA